MIRARHGVVAWLALGLTACSSPRLANCHIRCGPAEACPSGMTCQQGLCGQSGSSCSGSSVPTRTSFAPAIPPNAVLWLEADDGISAADGEPVTLWHDRSPADNSARQPDTHSAPRLHLGALNQHPVVRFVTPSWMIVADSTSMRWGTADFALWAVARCQCGSRSLIFHKTEVAPPWNGPELFVDGIEGDNQAGLATTSVYVNGSEPVTSGIGTFADGAPHIFGFQRHLTALQNRVDGAIVAEATRASTDVDAPGQASYVGADGLQPFLQFTGDIAALVAVKGPLLDSELGDIEAYLAGKYGVALVDQ